MEFYCLRLANQNHFRTTQRRWDKSLLTLPFFFYLSFKIAYGTSLAENHYLFTFNAGIPMVLLNRLRSLTEKKDVFNSRTCGNRDMAKGKNVLTTGDVAKICHVAPRTVSKWFDKGQLKGYRIPGSKDRRIPISELIRFMKVHNMPTGELAVGKIRVLIADSNDRTASTLAEILRTKADYDVQIVESTFETGAVVQAFLPHVVLVSFLAEDINALSICKGIREDEDLRTIKVIALANQLKDSEAAALLQKGFDGYVPYSADPQEVIAKIKEATAIIY